MLRVCLLFSILSTGLLFAAEPPPVPDFTRGDPIPDQKQHDWNLGPTGARGWVHAWKGTSADSRQILVTAVEEDSPSSGLLEKGDVILGIDGAPFSDDARITFARAITKAEASDGKLRLLRWRAGKTGNVELSLPVLGAYAETAPYHCPKSKAIFKKGCDAIAERIYSDFENDARRRHPIIHMLNALALLASGDPEYLPAIQLEAEWASHYEIDQGLHSWPAGWVNLFLAEYLLATGDESVKPNLEKLSYEIARGQSRVGTWGHRFAYEHNGILRGYGAMNQVGLSLTTSLIVAREAGVREKMVDEAIEKSQRFLSFYIGKGATPYGDHSPWLKMHDDNGKASASAVMFDLLGDRRGTEFFSRMATASYGVERETGHTGNFFNMLWALPGISRGGSEATGAWIGESAWLLDLARRHDGTFDYLGKPAATGGEHSYRGWDCTGAYLLGYALPLGKLRFTGSRASSIPPLTRKEAAELIADGAGWSPGTDAQSYEKRPTDQLFENLGSWSPVVRRRAAVALGKREGDFSVRLIAMAGSSDPRERLGACEALEQLGNRAGDAVPVLTDLLTDDDSWVRVQAAEALAGIGAPARSALPDLLRLVAGDRPDDDPRAVTQRFLAFALFYQGGAMPVKGLIGRSLEGVDYDLLVPAVEAVLQNEDGRVRGAVGSVFDLLSNEEIRPLLPAVYRAVVEQSPSGVMFSDGIRLRGLELLARYRIAEGLPLCIQLIELERWGGERRLERCLKILKSYGPNARAEVPSLRKLAREIEGEPKYAIGNPESRRHNSKMAKHHRTILRMIDELEGAEIREPLVNL